jgi:hypothetical protein
MDGAIPDPIVAVRAARDLLLLHGDAAVLAVARALDEWMARGGDFARALGLAGGWHSALVQRERDKALRELADRYFPALTGRALAHALGAAGHEYESRQFPKHYAARFRPDGRNGLLYDVALLGGMPCEETIRKRIGLK